MARLIEDGIQVSIQELYYVASFFDDKCVSLIRGPYVDILDALTNVDDQRLLAIHTDIRVVKSFVTVGEL
jgi:hypothetical protein